MSLKISYVKNLSQKSSVPVRKLDLIQRRVETIPLRGSRCCLLNVGNRPEKSPT
nr:MAG TPA: hypothetical protein [Caudoviricetes sp.]